MKQILPILSLSGSDATGGAGIQGDIKTITALGGYALTVVSTIVAQTMRGVRNRYVIPAATVKEQLCSVLDDFPPCAVKIGLLGSVGTAAMVAATLRGMPHIVYAPAVKSSNGAELKEARTLTEAGMSLILPVSEILVLRAGDAEVLLNRRIESNNDLVGAASELRRRGARNVLLYGGFSPSGLLTNVLLRQTGEISYFTLAQTDLWKTHGLGSTLSSAIAVFLAKNLEVEKAVSAAHEYIRSIVLYSVRLQGGFRANLLNRSSRQSISGREVELYNRMMQYVALHHKTRHDVAFYAGALCVTPRYLSQITRRVAGKSPKHLIDEYLLHECCRELCYTRKPVRAIAREYGFSNQGLFTRFLKKYKGCTPSQLRG